MRTSVMIRVDVETVKRAKDLDLSISKICEAALMEAVEEESRPYEIVESSQIVFDAELFYYKTGGTLGVVFFVTNTREENVILDRINYVMEVKSDEGKTSQIFKGALLERRTIRKGSVKESFGVPLTPSEDLAKILKGISHENPKGLTWVIFPDLFADSKKRILKAKFQQVWDETGNIPRPRPLKVV